MQQNGVLVRPAFRNCLLAGNSLHQHHNAFNILGFLGCVLRGAADVQLHFLPGVQGGAPEEGEFVDQAGRGVIFLAGGG